MQVQTPNHLELLWSKAMVVSVEGKGAARPRQVRIMKTNEIESLLTCRNDRDDIKTGSSASSRDELRGDLSTDWAVSGMEAT